MMLCETDIQHIWILVSNKKHLLFSIGTIYYVFSYFKEPHWHLIPVCCINSWSCTSSKLTLIENFSDYFCDKLIWFMIQMKQKRFMLKVPDQLNFK